MKKIVIMTAALLIGVMTASVIWTSDARAVGPVIHEFSQLRSCCSLGAVTGFRKRLQRAPTVVLGVAKDKGLWEQDNRWRQVLLEELSSLTGDIEADSLLMLVPAHDSHVSMGKQALYFLNAFEGGYVPSSVVPCEGRDAQQSPELIQALQGLGPAAGEAEKRRACAALALTLVEGGPEARRLAAFDLVHDITLANLMSPEQIDAVFERLDSLDFGDRAYTNTLLVAVQNKDPKKLLKLLDYVEREGSEVHAALFERLYRKAYPKEGVEALAARFEASEDLAVKLRCARVLSRLGGELSQKALAPYLEKDQNVTLQSEAFIAHAGVRSTKLRSLALDVLRSHISKTSPEEEPRAIKELLKERSRAGLEESPTGERYRLMAAGFVLTRMNDDTVNKWLKTHLDKLDDVSVIPFLRGRIGATWARFDDPY